MSKIGYICSMGTSASSTLRLERQHVARARRRRGDVWVAATALIASMMALPLAQSSWHGSEAAAVLAVSATAMLAGQRWAIALVVIAELLLAPSVAVKAFDGGLALWPGRIAALISMVAIVPGLLEMRRAAAAMVLLTGWRRTRRTCRRFQAALVALGFLGLLLPML